VAIVSIEWFRDLVICIWGLAATIAVIVIVVLILAAYFRVRPIIKSVKSVAGTVENISTCVEQEVVGPLAQVIAFIQGFRQAFGLIKRGKKKED
jgi:hypothetical protein